MSLNDLISLLGLLLSIVAIIISIAIFRFENSKTQIFYFRKQLVQLYDDLVRNVPDMQILFRGQQVEKTMFFSKGVFICSGKKDLTASEIEKGVIVSLRGQNVLWHTFRVTKTSSDFKYRLEESETQKRQIDFELFKNSDFIVIEGIGEGDNVFISYNHRIANVPPIVVNKVGIEKEINANVRMYLFSLLLFLAFFVFGFNLWSSSFYPESLIYNKSMQEVPYATAIDTLPTQKIDVKAIRESVRLRMDTTIFKDYSDSDKALINRIVDRDSGSYSQYEYPSYVDTRYAWENDDSVKQLAKKDYSKLSLFFKDTTKIYKLSSNYYVRYKTQNVKVDILIFLVLLTMIIISLFLSAKTLAKYFRYKKIAAIVTVALADN